MLRKSKGYTGIEVIMILGVIGIIAYTAFPAVGKGIHDIFSGGQNQKKSTHMIQHERMLYQEDPAIPGKFIPAGTEKYLEKSYNFDATKPPETLWQKFLHLGIMIVPIIALISYLGAWPLINIWVKRLKGKIKDLEESQDTLTDEAKLIVKSVDEGLATLDPASKEKFLTAMSRRQDSTTKMLVSELKNG